MNFGNEIKKEIIIKQIKDRCCKKAFLCGYFRGAGQFVMENGQLGLEVKFSDEDRAEYVINLLSYVYGYEPRDYFVSDDKLNKKDNIVFSINGKDGINVLEDLSLITVKNGEYFIDLKFFSDLTEKQCCLRSFLRGLFLANGRCSIGDVNGKSGYHLEIAFTHAESISATEEKLSDLGVSSKTTIRKGQYILYIKSAEDIKDFLAYLNVPVSVLKLTDIIIEKDMVNNINRKTNCDLGNVNRQIEASARQIECINKLKEKRYEDLKDELKITAEYRLKYPEDTLNELAKKLEITKSCLNHRLRKLLSIAEKL